VFFTVNTDPCVTAGDIFKCGMNKDKLVMQNTVAKNAVAPGEVPSSLFK